MNLSVPAHLPPAAQVLWHGADSSIGTGDRLLRAFTHYNYAIGMHTHDFFEVNIVTGGTGHHYIGDMRVAVHTGDVFVIPPQVMHGYYCEAGLNVYHLLLSNPFMERYHRELNGFPGFAKMFTIEPYLRQVYDENLFLRLEPGERSGLFAQLEELTELESQGWYVCENITTLALLSRLCRMMELRNRRLPRDNTEGEILAIMEYIRLHPDEKLTLPVLAARTHMSRSTFCRRFQRIARLSPGDYVQRCRVELAVRLLNEGRLKKSDIAQQCGFYDVSHMNRVLNDLSLRQVK